MNAVEEHDEYFVQKRNAANVLGLSCFQKVTAAMRMLSYGMAADMTDEYVRIAESTTLDSVRHFVRAVVEVFGDEYLRHPNETDNSSRGSINRAAGRRPHEPAHRSINETTKQ